MNRESLGIILGIIFTNLLIPWSTAAQTSTFQSRRLEGLRTEPVVGPRLQRSSSFLRVHLRDHDGRILTEADIPGVPGFRFILIKGPFRMSIWDHRWEGRTGTLILGPHGLEPGTYMFDLDGGAYGTAHLRVEVAKDRIVDKLIRLPGYRRVITLRFLDEKGRGVQRLASLPRFVPRHKNRPPIRERRPNPRLMPLDGCSRRRGCLFHPIRSWIDHETIERDEAVLTDDGLFFLPVVAGVEGSLSVPVSPLCCPVPHRLSSTFEEPHWDDFVVRIRSSPRLEAFLGTARIVNPRDPGNRTRAAVDAPLRGGALLRMFPWDQIVRASGPTVRVSAPIPIDDAIQLRIALKKEGSAIDTLPLLERHGDSRVQWCDVPLNSPCLLQFGDGLLYETPCSDLLLEGGPPSYLPPVDRGLPFAVDVIVPSTLAGMRKPLLIQLSINPWVQSPWRQRSIRLEKHGRYRIRSSIHPKTLDTIQSRGGSLLLRFGRLMATQDPLVIQMPLTSDLMSKACGKGAVIDISNLVGRDHRLLARCVGRSGEGLPWVEGSVIPIGEEELAVETQQTMERLRGSGNLPAWHNLAELPEVEVPIDALSDSIAFDWKRLAGFLAALNDEQLKLQAGRSLAQAFTDPKQLRHFLAKGSWYDAWRVVRSGPRGYIVARVRALIPGRHYVLYLWSKSRDPLKPDGRVVFQAHPGFTDLGVISLPSY